jgi:hypothetical protein
LAEFAAFYVYLCILFCLKHTIWTFAPVYPTVWSVFNLQAPVYPTVHCIPVEYLSIYHLSKGCHNLSVTAYLVIVSIYLSIHLFILIWYLININNQTCGQLPPTLYIFVSLYPYEINDSYTIVAFWIGRCKDLLYSNK